MKFLLYEKARKNHIEIRKLKKHSETAFSDEVNKKFDDFISINMQSVRYGRWEIKKIANSDKYKAFICGSDQIWSPLSLHLPSYKFLEFAPKEKRIAYAPSFGIGYIPEYNQKHIFKALHNMQHISIREEQGADLIESITQKRPPVLLDPTMLLSGDEWRNLYKKHSTFTHSHKYILCYFFEDPKPSYVEKICGFAEENHLKIVVLFNKNTNFLQRKAILYNAGPWEFLSLVDNAEYIFTNSFHGCVFSLLFGKPLMVFERKHSNLVKQTSRIESLLEKAFISSHYANLNNKDFSFLDSSCAEKNLKKCRESSFSYLKNVLNIEE